MSGKSAQNVVPLNAGGSMRDLLPISEKLSELDGIYQVSILRDDAKKPFICAHLKGACTVLFNIYHYPGKATPWGVGAYSGSGDFEIGEQAFKLPADVVTYMAEAAGAEWD